MRLWLIYSILVITFCSCVKAPEEDLALAPRQGINSDTLIKDSTNRTGKLLVLNEGLFRQGNASLSLIDLSDTSVINNVFLTINDRKLGDTGNDMLHYGSKIYIVVHASSTIEILDANSLQSVGQVHLFNSSTARLPRKLAFNEDMAYVTNYDGTVISFDTTSFQVQDTFNVGRNPEGICLFQNKLFVANSGGLDNPNYDNRLSIIDLKAETVVQKEIDINLSSILQCNDRLYLISRGNYSDQSSELYQVDEMNHESILSEATHLTSFKETLIVGGYNYRTNKSALKWVNSNDNSLTKEIFLLPEYIRTLYGVNVGPDGTLYLSDSNGFVSRGSVCFYRNNKVIKKVKVGINPHCVVYIK